MATGELGVGNMQQIGCVGDDGSHRSQLQCKQWVSEA
jgi:hypothetical protein